MMIINKGELILMTTKPYNKDNLILIGMPGAGKSTIGIVLAKIIGYTFIDSDIIIQNEKNMLLHELIDKYGLDGFNSIENEINSKIKVSLFLRLFVQFFY